MTDDQGTPPAAVTAAEVKTVDYETYQRVVQAKTNLESQVNALKAERDGALEKASTVDSVVQDRDSWKAKAEQESTRFGRYQAIAATTGNSDPEAMELVEYAYGRVPEEGRPELADWLTGFKADPTTAPLALRSVFEQSTPEATPRPKPVPSRANPPGGSAEVTSEKVLAVRQRAQSTGDWAEYSELRKQMGFVR
jgi:hypothetical protein